MLSIAQVATLINFGVVCVQVTIGLGLVVCLVSFIRATDSAVTWSNIARTLHSSYWPNILFTDSTATTGLSRRIHFFNAIVLISWILIAIAGVITPLGLAIGIKEGARRAVGTRYVKDDSSTGRAMAPRDDYHAGRFCSGGLHCPGQLNYYGLVPQNISTKFSAEYSTLALQFRNFFGGKFKQNDLNGTSISMGYLGQTESFVLRDDIFAIEGAVVDMRERRAGIGFLNHSLPAIDNEGASWTRDILWLEPITECTDTNITFEYTTEDFLSLPQNITLVDHGGFWNLTGQELEDKDIHDDQQLNLREKTRKTAINMNRLLMLSLNISQNETFEGYQTTLDGFTTTLNFGTLAFNEFTDLFYVDSAADFWALEFNGKAWEQEELCRGYAYDGSIPVGPVAVSCCYMLGPPNRLDHGDSRQQEVNLTWYQPWHVCASVARLTIQKVGFTYNATHPNISTIKVERDPENIEKNVLWGMEKLAGWNVGSISPFYGKVNDEWENCPDLIVKRDDWFYVPAGSNDVIDVTSSLDFQASDMLGIAWAGRYDNFVAKSWTGDQRLFQIDGASNFAMRTKWQNYYLESTDTAPAAISNLVFIDVIANNVVGTTSADNLIVIPSDKSITYDVVYAIPAILLLALWGLIMLYTFVLLVTGKAEEMKGAGAVRMDAGSTQEHLWYQCLCMGKNADVIIKILQYRLESRNCNSRCCLTQSHPLKKGDRVAFEPGERLLGHVMTARREGRNSPRVYELQGDLGSVYTSGCAFDSLLAGIILRRSDGRTALRGCPKRGTYQWMKAGLNVAICGFIFLALLLLH
ncbi:hypothetical protein BT69DRAFT_1319582, partial [Atractiella rhizophila]